MSQYPDLLPPDILVRTKPEFLWELLQHQAHLFETRTKGIITPFIRVRKGTEPKQLAYEFHLALAEVDGFYFRLFTVETALIETVPCRLLWNESIREIRTEEELLDELRRLFADPTTLRVVGRLLQLSRPGLPG